MANKPPLLTPDPIPIYGRKFIQSIRWTRPVRWCLSFFASRLAVAQLHREFTESLAKSGQDTLEETNKRERLRIELSSALATIADRERDIAFLKQEKAQLQAEIAVRLHEVEELNQWLERVRVRLNADIAQEVAREMRAIGPRPPAPSNQAN